MCNTGCSWKPPASRCFSEHNDEEAHHSSVWQLRQVRHVLWAALVSSHAHRKCLMWRKWSFSSKVRQIFDSYVLKSTKWCVLVIFRSVLTGLKVDPAALLSVETDGQIKALIVTMKGNHSHFRVFYVGLVLSLNRTVRTWVTSVFPSYVSTGSPDCQPGYDFYSRNFAPWVGIAEDPVTGEMIIVITASKNTW